MKRVSLSVLVNRESSLNYKLVINLLQVQLNLMEPPHDSYYVSQGLVCVDGHRVTN